MIDIHATTQSQCYNHIVQLYLDFATSRIFVVCFHLYVGAVN